MAKTKPLLRELTRTRYQQATLLLGVASAVAIVVHTVFTNTHRFLPAGTKSGPVLYELSLAYVASFIFYLLVVALPDVARRRRLKPIIRAALDGIVGDKQSILMELGATEEESRNATRADIERWCSSANTHEGVPRVFLVDKGFESRDITKWQAIAERVQRTEKSMDRIQGLMPFLDAELVHLLDQLESCFIFWQVRDYLAVLLTSTNSNFAVWKDGFADYSDIVMQLKAYRDREMADA